MKPNLSFNRMLCSVLFSISSLGYAQKEFNNTPDYSWADLNNASLYLELFQGKRYFDNHRILNNKHKYFRDYELLEGSVIFDNDHYSNLQFKFDLHEQQIALYHPNSDGVTLIAIDMNRVNAFKIDGAIFVKHRIDKQVYLLEYIDTFQGKELWIFHQKTSSFRMDGKVGYYEFNPKETLFVFDNKGWQRSDAVKIEHFYPNWSSTIKNWSKEWRTRKKTDASSYLKSLLNFLKSS